MNSRNIDPLTSKLSALQAESCRGENEEKVLELLRSVDGLSSYQLSEVLEIPYVTISPLMRPMARRGLVHEVGTVANPGSGHKAILWAIGPAPGWKPGHSLPAVATGPHTKSVEMFMPDEIRAALGSFHKVEDFTDWLNNELLERVH